MTRVAVASAEDLTAYLNTYPAEVAFGDDDAGEVLDRYHAPDFELVNDGIRLDRERLLAHVRPVRRNATSVRTEVHQALVCEDRVAAHYSLHATLRRGRAVHTEIYMFGQLARDGRICRIHQITRNTPA